MIPRSLHLTNFLSYVDMPEPLDFSTISIACLSGANGHGKSALLDAITWSLWGKARGCEGGQEQERLIRDGAEAMSVEFSFELEGQTYRVVRTRTRTGKAEILFNVRAPDASWTDLAGEGIADTQRRIIERLRMDYETFVASAFILQGRADTFTRLDPKDRKAVLGKILGLEVYERLADRSKERRKEHAAEAEGIARGLEAVDQALARRPELEHAREGAATALVAAEAERTAAEASAAAFAQTITELRGVEAAAAEAEKRRLDLAGTLTAEEAAHAGLEERAQRLAAEATLDPTATELAGRLPGLETEERRAEDARARHDELSIEAASLDARLSQERSRLESEIAGLERRAAQIEKEIASEPEARAVLEAAAAQLAELEEVASKREALLARHAEIRERRGALEAERKGRETERAETEEKVALLSSAGAGCPLCGEPLTPGHRKEVRAGFTARLKELDAADRAAAKEARALATEAAAVEKEGAALRDALARREQIAKQAAALQERIEQYAVRRGELDTARASQQDARARLRADDFALGEREKLARIREEIAAVGFDRSAFDELRRVLVAARAAERSIAGARAAEATLAATRAELESSCTRIERLRSSAAAASRDLDAMRERLRALPGLLEEARSAERARASAQARVEETTRSLAASEAALSGLDAQAKEAAASRLVLAAAKRSASLYEKLVRAFGRDGIPARIVGNAIPELRHEANRLLTLLTDGQLSVSIDPIRETKSRSLKETLEVTVYDAAGGKRPYEMYSGGERLRIDFAIRVALSRLLAGRSGARLETLVIDEGFGSQDSDGRRRLLDAVMKVRGEFRTVLVITHIEELKEYFPVRIEVRKDPAAGSQVRVA